MQIVSHCYTSVLYEPISKLYIFKNLVVYLSDARVTLNLFYLFYLFIYLFILQGTGTEKPDFSTYGCLLL